MKFLKEDYKPYEYEDLEYEFELTIPYGEYDYWGGDRSEKTVDITWTYSVHQDDVKDFLMDKLPEDLPENEIDAYFEEHYDDMVEKHLEEIKDYFEDDAKMDAYQNYEDDGFDGYDDYDRYDDYEG